MIESRFAVAAQRSGQECARRCGGERGSAVGLPIYKDTGFEDPISNTSGRDDHSVQGAKTPSPTSPSRLALSSCSGARTFTEPKPLQSAEPQRRLLDMNSILGRFAIHTNVDCSCFEGPSFDETNGKRQAMSDQEPQWQDSLQPHRSPRELVRAIVTEDVRHRSTSTVP